MLGAGGSSQGGAHQSQLSSHENLHASNVIETEQMSHKVYVTTIDDKEEGGGA